jgi:hypothetical protein
MMTNHASPLLDNNQSTNAETLRVVVASCLWHEPHALREIIAKTATAHHLWSGPKRALKKYVCSVLRESLARGLMKYSSGLFLLTAQGREETGKAFGLDG